MKMNNACRQCAIIDMELAARPRVFVSYPICWEKVQREETGVLGGTEESLKILLRRKDQEVAEEPIKEVTEEATEKATHG